MPTTVYGDISPRTAAYASKELLERANPLLVLERFGQAKPLPEKSSKTIKFRRYNSLDPTPNPLTEGVTPSGKKMTATDVSASVVQYGDFIEISDVVQDTHEDPVLKEGMVLVLNPHVQGPGGPILYSRDTVLLDFNGCKILGWYKDWREPYVASDSYYSGGG